MGAIFGDRNDQHLGMAALLAPSAAGPGEGTRVDLTVGYADGHAFLGGNTRQRPRNQAPRTLGVASGRTLPSKSPRGALHGSVADPTQSRALHLDMPVGRSGASRPEFFARAADDHLS